MCATVFHTPALKLQCKTEHGIGLARAYIIHSLASAKTAVHLGFNGQPLISKVAV